MSKYMSSARARLHFTRARLLELFDYDPLTGACVVRATGLEVSAENNYGYRWVWAEGAALLVHRIAWRVMTGDWPAGMVDHVDGGRTNNAWANLRETDHSKNAQNQHKAMCTSSTGVLGVHTNARSRSRPYRAAIEVGQRKRFLGAFATAQEAHEAYLKAKAIYHPTASVAWSKA